MGLKLNLSVILEEAKVFEEGDRRKYVYETVNEPHTFNRVLKHLQLEGYVGNIPEVYVAGEVEGKEIEMPVCFGSKNFESLVKSLLKVEATTLKEWEKYMQKLAKAKQSGKELDEEPPVDSVRYRIVTVVNKDGNVEEMHFDKVLFSEMCKPIVILRYTVHKTEEIKLEA